MTVSPSNLRSRLPERVAGGFSFVERFVPREIVPSILRGGEFGIDVPARIAVDPATGRVADFIAGGSFGFPTGDTNFGDESGPLDFVGLAFTGGGLPFRHPEQAFAETAFDFAVQRNDPRLGIRLVPGRVDPAVNAFINPANIAPIFGTPGVRTAAAENFAAGVGSIIGAL